MCNPPPSRALEAVRVKGKAKPVVKGAGSKGKKADGVFDVWASKAPRARGVNKLARKLTAPTTNAKAVAPEHPGCSFNPPKDAREDVVAVALAKEFKAKQARYLDPVTVPVSNVVAEANLVNELYFESGFGEDETDEIEDETGGRGRGAGKTSTTKTLLALIHSSEAPWPDRVEVLVNALIALEADRGGGYEVLVVLDSFGEPMDRNVCKVGR